jgi:CheY-like chemotaxis protein
MEQAVLIVDDDASTEAALHVPLEQAGISVTSTNDSLAAINLLREHDYSAIVLDPMIRYRLNGYAVLHYIEQERPDSLPHVFLYSGMSRQTVARTAPELVSRLYRKPAGLHDLSAAVIEAAAPHGSNRTTDAKGTVLLVEDDALTARVTAGWLERVGYQSVWVTSGEKVLDAEFASAFDFIMLDLVLPDMDGFAVLRRLRAKNPQLLDRIIVTTGMPVKYLTDRVLDRVRAVLHKPLDKERLREILRPRMDITMTEGAGEAPVLH